MAENKGSDPSPTDPYAYLRSPEQLSPAASYLPVDPASTGVTPYAASTIAAAGGAGAAGAAGTADPVLDGDASSSEDLTGVTRRQLREVRSRRDLRPPPRKSRLRPVLIGAAAVVVAGGATFGAIRLLGGDEDASPDPTGTATASVDPSATADPTDGVLSPLEAMLPRLVQGGEFSDEETSGMTYSITADGFIQNTNAPEGALESIVGIYAGGAAPVTLTASRFPTAEAALADATASAEAIGNAVDYGYVYPETETGIYWIFNNDGLITVIWTDGELGSFTVVSEDVAAGLDFYYGLGF